jgi:Domain of unknown function (DUF3883)
MPLILSTNEATESGPAYADVTGVSYEFPKRYQKLIRAGERFIYYHGRRKAGGGTQPQMYFGTGIIGEVTPSPGGKGLLACRILDYRPFRVGVSLRWPEGGHVEPGGAAGGLYYQTGVRLMDETTYDRILEAGEPLEPAPAAAHATPETAHEVDAYAMRTAMLYLRATFPGATVTRMTHNNPGYDVRVETTDGEGVFIEVKGTQSASPRFFISEGERLFAERNQATYMLLIIYDIDRSAETHQVLAHQGPPIGEMFILAPTQWIGALRSQQHGSGPAK